MDKETENYLRGSMGDRFAGGLGQLGYENHKREQERQRAEREKMTRGAGGNASGRSSLKELLQGVLILLCVEAIMNFTGYLEGNFQRIAAFICGAALVVVIQLYWDLIVRIVIGIAAITAVVYFGYDFLSGN